MERPSPMVPEEVDLTDFKFMPLEVARLLQSEWWIIACSEDPRRAVAAVNLWARSWHQRPAASLPDNDVVLSKLADVTLAVWREIKADVMEPWCLCSDNRWYHPVVAEKAIDAWSEKSAYRERRQRWQESGRRGGLKRAGNRTEGTLEANLEGTLEATLEATIEASLQAKGRGKGKGTGIKERDKSLLSDAGASGDPDALNFPATRLPSEGYTAEFEAWWAIYPRKDSKGSAFKAFKAAKGRATIVKLIDGAAAYAKRRVGEDPQYTKQPATWLNADAWNDEEPPKPRRNAGYTPMGVGG